MFKRQDVKTIPLYTFEVVALQIKVLKAFTVLVVEIAYQPILYFVTLIM